MPPIKLLAYLSLMSFLLLPAMVLGQSWDKSAYAGFRCAILQVSDVRVDDNGVRFSCSLANTGRETVRFEPDHRSGVVVFTADRSLEEAGLAAEQDLIALGMLRSGLTLKPGQMVTGKKFEFSRDLAALPATHAAAPGPPIMPQEDEDIHQTPKGNTGAAKDDFIPLIDPDREGCPDLVIDSLWILDERKNSMHVAIRMSNRGDGPATLYTADKQDKGMGVSFYFGTTDRISRGSLFIQGEHVDDGLASSDGQLLPGQSLVKEVKVNTRRHTRFLTALQCRLDTFQRVHECDESNNEFVHFLR